MIVIVEDRGTIVDAYRASFSREGFSASGFSPSDFEDWVLGAPEDDVSAVDAFLIGECEYVKALANLIRRRCTAAIIAMKEQKSLSGTLQLFAEGVDDVVVKPCHIREILARIEAISRRARLEKARGVEAGVIRVFRDGGDPLILGNPIMLPRRELRILEYLVASSSRFVTKAQIFSSVYGLFDHDIDENVIESHISKLRRRLRERLSYDPIESRRHLGYRLVCRPQDGVVLRT
jgi:two-component system, OmpR family, flagellar system response regulator FtcR